MTRGGKREGAGRPAKTAPKQARRYMANLTTEEERALLRLMSERRESASRVLAAGLAVLAGEFGGGRADDNARKPGK